MARDGSGTYSLPATFATANQVAQSATVNSIMADIAQALTDSVNKDGTKAFAAAQSMGNNKLTNLAAGTAAADAARLSQVQSGVSQQATTVGGTVDAITLAFTPAVTAYATGQRIRWVSGGANTIVAPSVNCDSLGAKTIKKNPNGAALAVGDLGVSGTILEAVYNGTDFILLNPPSASPASASDTVAGLVELATTTETLTGTDATRAVTPDGLAALWEQGSDIASAGTITVGEGGYFNVTGTTTITDIDPGTDKAGRRFFLKFAAALTLTHNASTLILPGGANITTAAGDIAEFVSEGSDAVRCVGYTKASGRAVVEPSSGAWVVIGTASPSGAASVDFTNLSSYRALRATFMGLRPATDDVRFKFRYSTDNGSSYTETDSTVNSIGRDTADADDTVEASDATNSGVFDFDGTVATLTIGNVSTDGAFGGEFLIVNFNAANHANWFARSTFGNGSGVVGVAYAGGIIKTTTARNAIQFLMSSGNIATGFILLEGYVG